MGFQQPKKWCDWLPAAEWWYNFSYHSAIQMTPFQSLYEYSPPLLRHIPVPFAANQATTTETPKRDKMAQLLHQNITKAQQCMKEIC
jgi:hypothetical protein